MFGRVSLKIGKMQTEQEFIVSIASIVASNQKVIALQSEQCAAVLYPGTGLFIFTDFGPHHKHLSAYGKPMDIPGEDKDRIIVVGKQIYEDNRLLVGW